MLALTEKQALIQALGQVVYDEVRSAITPLQDRVMQLEKTLGDLAVTSKDPALGEFHSAENQPAVDLEFLRQYVAEALEAHAQTYPVRDGKHGKDSADGHDSADGKSVSLDELRDCVADLVAEAIGNLPVQPHCTGGIIDRDGALSLTFSDGDVKNVGKVVGADGKDCDMEMVRRQVAEFLATIEKPKDGIDGLGIEQIEYDGERTFRLANAKVDRSFVIPFPLYQGLWKQGNYSRGDEVTSDGSQFIAMRDTDKEPGTLDSGWRLACKRGGTGGRGPPGKDAGKP
jgi:hypothetical protein